MNIRPIKENEISQLIDLCAAHAEFEKSAYDRNGKGNLLKTELFSTTPKITCLVAEIEGKLEGYITYMFQYSTWEAKEYIYMDCLYINDAHRGKGIGEKLVLEMKDHGRKNAISLVQWQTPDFNVRAIKFYKRIGAYSKSKERFFLPI